MLFSEVNFWIIFPLIFSVYWIIPQKYSCMRKYWLILVSYLLYMNWKASFAIVLLLITIVTFVGAKTLERKKNRKICIFFVLFSLSPLLIFKYYNFVNEIGHDCLQYIGLSFRLPGLNWGIPIGISFYTFQAIGYMLDVYYGKINAEEKFSDYLLFCSFFPQTISGPISKASELLPQIKKLPPFDYFNGVKGLQYLLWGLFLKCVMADRLGVFVDLVFNNYERFSGANCLVASIFYSFQIYGDFAGYSLIAVGVAKLLNINIVNNFDRPYFAESVTSFWRRWHISLTRWLTAYIYIPLGGSRCSKKRQYLNIMTTFLVSGIWHGANWTFIIWGLIHGLFQITEKWLGVDPKGKNSSIEWIKKVKALRILITFLLVSFAWIFFRSNSLLDAWHFIVKIFLDFGNQPIMNELPVNHKIFFVLIISITFFVDFILEFFKDKITFFTRKRAFMWMLYLFLVFIIATCSVLNAGQFIYVSF